MLRNTYVYDEYFLEIESDSSICDDVLVYSEMKIC